MLNKKITIGKKEYSRCDICPYSPKNSQQKYEEVEIELSDEVFIEIAKMAHELDLTFNQFANLALRKKLEELNNDHKKG